MITIKNKSQIKKITKSCRILAQIKKVIFDAIRPGISLKELDQVAFKEMKKNNVQPAFLGLYGFPATICASVNEELIHGIPSDCILKNKDLVSIDVGVIYQGYYSDSAFTKSVGESTPENDFLIKVAKKAFYEGFKQVKVGNRTGDIAHAIGKYLKSKKLFTPPNFSGHGIGTELHEEPAIFNNGDKNTGAILKNGMVICIEPMVLQNSSKTVEAKDGWTILSHDNTKTSHYEHTILIKDGHGIILTEGI